MFPVRCVTYVPGLYRMPANITMNPTAASLRSAAAGYRARSPDLERAAVAA